MRVLSLATATVLALALTANAYEWYTYNGHQYALTNGWGTWAECEAEAIAAGGHLVTVNDVAEKNWLVDPTRPFGSVYSRDHYGEPGQNGFWVGLRYHGGDIHTQDAWEWISGEPIGYWAVQPSFYYYDGIHMVMTGTYHHIGVGEFSNGPHHDVNSGDNLMGIIEVAPEPGTLTLLALGGTAVIRRRHH